MPDKARVEPAETHAHESEPKVDTAISGKTKIGERAPVAAPGADYNLRIIGPLVGYVRDNFGEGALTELSLQAGLAPESVSKLAGWMSWEQCETLLAAILNLVGGQERFDEACVHRFVESWGPFRYITWALTPLFMYQGAGRANKTLSAVAEFSVETKNASRVIVTYKSSKQESRLLCATRRVALTNLPTFFGLPHAHLQERKCIARGDEACEYDISWTERRRWFPTALGATIGAAAALGLSRVEIDHSLILLLLPMLGAAVGHIVEHRRNEKASVANVEEANAALQKLIAEEAEARREILALNERQRDWDRAVEETQIARADAIQDVLQRAEKMQQQRETTLLGFSHDLRNPLMVLASTVDFLRDAGDALGEEGPQLIEDVESSIEQMKRMLGDFVAAATSQQDLIKLSPKQLEVASLTLSLTRRLRALAQGKPIVPSVMQTREAPETIVLDPLVFDRVTDNLLTNATKYTERGSIVVEVTGSPGFIVIKISDTGRGIAEADLEKIFQPGGSNKEKRARDSFGVGLSVILQLLEQVGGNLEVMSTVGRGTTFWAYFPTGMDDAKEGRAPLESGPEIQSAGQALSGRVRIRKPPA